MNEEAEESRTTGQDALIEALGKLEEHNLGNVGVMTIERFERFEVAVIFSTYQVNPAEGKAVMEREARELIRHLRATNESPFVISGMSGVYRVPPLPASEPEEA